MKPIWKHIIATVCALLVVAYMVFGLWMSYHQTASPKCHSLVVEIQDREERQYISEAEIQQLIRDKGQYPVGKAGTAVSLQSIENIVRHHDMIRQAECYRTMQGNVHIRLTQRIPLVRIIAGTETYFIDTDRKPMPVRESIKTPVLVVTGDVSKRMAQHEVSDFALWLEDNAYWMPRIARVEVCNPKMVHLIQYNGLATIIAGDWNNMDGKLGKLRHWYENSSYIDTEQYPMLDVRFMGQVIGCR